MTRKPGSGVAAEGVSVAVTVVVPVTLEVSNATKKTRVFAEVTPVTGKDTDVLLTMVPKLLVGVTPAGSVLEHCGPGDVLQVNKPKKSLPLFEPTGGPLEVSVKM